MEMKEMAVRINKRVDIKAIIEMMDKENEEEEDEEDEIEDEEEKKFKGNKKYTYIFAKKDPHRYMEDRNI